VHDEIFTALFYSKKVRSDVIGGRDILTTFIEFSDADIPLVDGENENLTSP
jgi:hypothetical protein